MAHSATISSGSVARRCSYFSREMAPPIQMTSGAGWVIGGVAVEVGEGGDADGGGGDFELHGEVIAGWGQGRRYRRGGLLSGSNEICLLTTARGHIAGFGGVALAALLLARNVSPTPDALT